MERKTKKFTNIVIQMAYDSFSFYWWNLKSNRWEPQCCNKKPWIKIALNKSYNTYDLFPGWNWSNFLQDIPTDISVFDIATL